eukprot:11089-Pelagomonas_calceolata.AAC.17
MAVQLLGVQQGLHLHHSQCTAGNTALSSASTSYAHMVSNHMGVNGKMGCSRLSCHRRGRWKGQVQVCLQKKKQSACACMPFFGEKPGASAVDTSIGALDSGKVEACHRGALNHGKVEEHRGALNNGKVQACHRGALNNRKVETCHRVALYHGEVELYHKRALYHGEVEFKSQIQVLLVGTHCAGHEPCIQKYLNPRHRHAYPGRER